MSVGIPPEIGSTGVKGRTMGARGVPPWRAPHISMNTAVPVLLVLNAAVALLLSAVGFARRRTPGGRPFAVVMVAVAAWSVLNASQILSSDPETKRGLAQLAYPCIVVGIVAWWWCCSAYAGRTALATRRTLLFAAVPGVVTLVLVAAGARSTLMWTSLVVEMGPGPVVFPPGPWFRVHSVWAFALILGGLLIVARTMLRAPRAYLPQLAVLLVAIAVPLVVNAGTVQTGLVDTGGHDFTPIALLVSGTVLGFGLLRLGLLDLVVGVVPVAHDSVVASMRDGIVIVGTDGRVIGANPSAGLLLGRQAPPAIGTDIAERLPTWAPGPRSEIEVRTGADIRIVEMSSSPIDENRGHVITLRDVTDARAAERALRHSFERASHQAQHDPLTGLPNRRLLFNALHEQTGPYALVILDLDGFKSVNDMHGHGAGDEVLSQLARRLQAASRPESVVARLGGDEFAILMPGVSERPAELATRVAVDALSAPIVADGHEVVLTASAGIALAPQHGTHVDAIVRAADVAMYSAKRARNRVALYGDVDDSRSPDRVLLVHELRRALASGEIVCHYQPQARPNGAVRGVEALVRWRHPDRGLLSPASFLKAAKQGGLMRQLSDRVLDVAARDLGAWVSAGRDWIVSVNLDAEDLGDPRLAHRVAAALGRAEVSPERLTVEITESAVFDTSTGARTLAGLRGLGVSVALDDFGTGYGPLAHLRKLPIDELKLDQSFVSGLIRDRRDAALVAGQIRIGHDLGLTVVAEGVESAACRTRLLELHCDVLQGFHVGVPAAASDLGAAATQFA
jgi:diguanylate cyclase (GGDEF)-like protein